MNPIKRIETFGHCGSSLARPQRTRGATAVALVGQYGAVERARITFEQLAFVGIDIDQITAKLEAEGVEKFSKPFDELLRRLEGVLKAA